jgi:hypothetical protein
VPVSFQNPGHGELKLSRAGSHPQDPICPGSQRPLYYVVDWLPPDFGAVGQYALLFAREIAESGRSVTVIGLTSNQGRSRTERLGTASLETRWVRAKRYNKSGLVRRLTWSLGANLKLVTEVIRDPRSRNAEVLFTGSPPFMLFFALIVKWLRGAKLIYRITDFYPEVLIAALGQRPWPLRLFERLTWWFRLKVDSFQVLGEDQRRLLVAGGIEPARIRLKRDVAPVLITGNERPLAKPPELGSCRVLLYSGNYGVAHEVDTVVDGLLRHRQAGGEFGLWLNASGTALGSIISRLQKAGVPVAHTQPGPLDQLPNLLAAADAHLVTLRPEFSGLVLPSKIYACLSSRRPILFVGPKTSDVHLLCSQSSNAYEQVDPGDPPGFEGALARLSNQRNPPVRLRGDS